MPGQHWSGNALLSPGFGVFRGAIGDSALHAHYAHQLVISLHGEIGVAFPTGPLRAPELPSRQDCRIASAPTRRSWSTWTR